MKIEVSDINNKFIIGNYIRILYYRSYQLHVFGTLANENM